MQAVDKVDDVIAGQVVKQTVDGEVPPPRIIFDAAPLVVASDQRILIAALGRGAKRAGLDDLGPEKYMGEFESPADDAGVAKGFADRFGCGRGRDIKVLGSTLEVEIANTPAHEIGLVSVGEEFLDDFDRVGVDVAEAKRARALVGIRHELWLEYHSRQRIVIRRLTRAPPTQFLTLLTH